VFREPKDMLHLVCFIDLPHRICIDENAEIGTIAVHMGHLCAQARKTSTTFKPTVEEIKDKLLMTAFKYRELMKLGEKPDLIPKSFIHRVFKAMDEMELTYAKASVPVIKTYKKALPLLAIDEPAALIFKDLDSQFKQWRTME
jgi:hypothetical protein